MYSVYKNITAQCMAKMQAVVGEAKLDGIHRHIRAEVLRMYESYLINDVNKVAIFVHHKKVKDYLYQKFLEDYSEERVFDFTAVKNRTPSNISRFEQDKRPWIALLSLKTLSKDISMKSVKLWVFAELLMTPTPHIQAEKHLLTEDSNIKEIQYLVGEQSKVEEWIVKLLQKKQWQHSISFKKASDPNGYFNHKAFNFNQPISPEMEDRIVFNDIMLSGLGTWDDPISIDYTWDDDSAPEEYKDAVDGNISQLAQNLSGMRIASQHNDQSVLSSQSVDFRNLQFSQDGNPEYQEGSGPMIESQSNSNDVP